MKQPTLKDIIEQAENKLIVEHWIRLKDLNGYFIGVTSYQITQYVNEMSNIDEFKPGVMRPGHSTTFVHYWTFVWFLRWKEANKGLKRKIPPKEIESYRWVAV